MTARGGEPSAFVGLNRIDQQLSHYHRINLTLFVRGHSDCDIVLSPASTLNRDKDEFYEIGELE